MRVGRDDEEGRDEPALPSGERAAACAGLLSLVGTSNAAGGLTDQYHHPRFDIDEAALPTAVHVLVGVVERYLGGEQ